MPGFAAAVCGPFSHIRAHGPRLIENYLDAAHFPFVHEGVLGDPQQPVLGEFEARIGPNGVESDPIAVYQPDPYGGTSGVVTYTYHAYLYAPVVACKLLWVEGIGAKFLAMGTKSGWHLWEAPFGRSKSGWHLWEAPGFGECSAGVASVAKLGRTAEACIAR